MTNKQVEKMVKKAFSNSTPDMFDKILEKTLACEESPKIVEMPRRNNAFLRKMVSVAAAVAIILTSGLAGFAIANFEKVDSIISFDVNPSIEIKINRNEKILEAKGLNEDGKLVLGDMDLEGSNISVAVNAIVGSMVRNGYIDELSNSILITVDNRDEKRSAELEKMLTDEVNAILNSENFDAEVISQTVSKSKEIIRLAEEYGITSGKAQLIKQITDKNDKYKFKDLATLTINQLNMILSGKDIEIGKDTNTKKEYISKTKAKKIALEKAKLSEDKVSDFSSTMDVLNGKMVYEILFRYDMWEYRYTIDAESGKITKDNVREIYLGFEEAKKIALKHAEINEAEITDYKISFSGEVYYLRFKYDLVEYRIRVDGILPEVIYSDPKMPEGSWVKWPIITEEEAKQVISYMLSGEIFDYKCEFTKNGIIPVYKITFRKPYTDFEGKQMIYCTFIINAYNGEEIGIEKNIVFLEENGDTASSENATSSEEINSENEAMNQ